MYCLVSCGLLLLSDLFCVLICVGYPADSMGELQVFCVFSTIFLQINLEDKFSHKYNIINERLLFKIFRFRKQCANDMDMKEGGWQQSRSV